MADLDEGEEYSIEELVPIPAKCSKCKRNWLGKDAIRAPSLRGCRCFYCQGELVPHPLHPPVIDAETKRYGLFAEYRSRKGGA